jgi:hypothetical protein
LKNIFKLKLISLKKLNSKFIDKFKEKILNCQFSIKKDGINFLKFYKKLKNKILNIFLSLHDKKIGINKNLKERKFSNSIGGYKVNRNIKLKRV